MRDDDEREFLNGLRQSFYETLEDAISACESLLLSLEEGGDESLLQELKREIHSVKGSASAVDLHLFAKYCHRFESFLDSHGKRDQEFFDTSLQVLDQLRAYGKTQPTDDVENEVIEEKLKAA